MTATDGNVLSRLNPLLCVDFHISLKATRPTKAIPGSLNPVLSSWLLRQLGMQISLKKKYHEYVHFIEIYNFYTGLKQNMYRTLKEDMLGVSVILSILFWKTFSHFYMCNSNYYYY